MSNTGAATNPDSLEAVFICDSGTTMSVKKSLTKQIGILKGTFSDLTFYERFEHAVVLFLTLLIIIVVALATWHLAGALILLIVSDAIHPANQTIFQTIFGMIFTVIIALEFKHSLLIVLARQESVVRVRSIILIAMLAMVRKFIIIDLGESVPAQLFSLSAAILALGVVYWLVRDQDRRSETVPVEG